MIRIQELFFILVVIIVLNGIFLVVSDKWKTKLPAEDIYTVNSVMSLLGPAPDTTSRALASVQEAPVKVFSNYELITEVPTTLKKFTKTFNIKSTRAWRVFLSECLSYSAKACGSLLNQLIPILEVKAEGKPTEQALLEKAFLQLVLLNCYMSHQYQYPSSSLSLVSCGQGRELAKTLNLSNNLAVNFKSQCAHGAKAACIEWYNYKLSIISASDKTLFREKAAYNQLYSLCKQKYVSACKVWTKYFKFSANGELAEGVLLQSCILGEASACEKLARVGSSIYANRGAHYLIKYCLDDNKHCEKLLTLTALPAVSYYKIPIYQKFCKRNYAGYCHLLALEEVKKYGLVVAKSNLMFRCDNFFRKAQRTCKTMNAQECKEFSQLCSEYKM